MAKLRFEEFISGYKENANTKNKLLSTTLDTGECGADDDGKDEVNVSLHDAAEEGNIDTVKSLSNGKRISTPAMQVTRHHQTEPRPRRTLMSYAGSSSEGGGGST